MISSNYFRNRREQLKFLQERAGEICYNSFRRGQDLYSFTAAGMISEKTIQEILFRDQMGLVKILLGASGMGLFQISLEHVGSVKISMGTDRISYNSSRNRWG